MAGKELSTLEKWRQRKKDAQLQIKLVPRNSEDPVPLSSGQKRLWLLEQLMPDGNLYAYAHSYALKGSVSRELLIRSFEHIVERHEILRTTYKEADGRLVQKVNATLLPPVEHLDLSHLAGDEQTMARKRAVKKLIQTPFDLTKDPALRLLFITVSESEIHLIVTIHHIAGDAWSMNIINQELSSIYRSLCEGKEASLPPLKLQYGDFAAWEDRKSTHHTVLDYWKSKLGGELPVLDLPKSGNQKGSFEGRTFHQKVSNDLARKIKSLATQQNVTPFTLLLTVYKILLGKYTANYDHLIATPFSTRVQADLEQNIGFFNESFVIRSEVDTTKDFKENLTKVNQAVLEALSNKETSFDEVVKAVKPERTSGSNPLFQTMFLYNTRPIGLTIDGVAIEEQVLPTDVSKFDTTLFVNEKEDHLELVIEYSIQYEDDFIRQLGEHYLNLLKSTVASPDKLILEVSMLSEKERLEKISSRNTLSFDLPKVAGIHTLLSESAKKAPAALALVSNEGSLSYGQLETYSDVLADKLSKIKTSKNEFIGLYTDRSLEMIVGIMGILKAGCAYIPLDPEYPDTRINYILEDAESDLILTQAHLVKQLKQSRCRTEVIDLDALKNSPAVSLDIEPSTEDVAYLIYTSGSTGEPKGVPVKHKHLLSSTLARNQFYTEDIHSFLLLSSFSFDSSIAGIFWTLCTGGNLILPPHRIEQDLETLSSLIEQYKISHTLLLPSLYRIILEHTSHTRLASLQVVMVAGEACPPGLVRDHFESLPTTKLYNEYGPTEATVWCIAQELTPRHALTSNVPIGVPIPNATAYILDQDQQIVPSDVPGELYIGGAGVTERYHKRKDLTKEKFVASPFDADEILYRTGDLAMYNKDGSISFIGRLDDQTKIRGHRIEPGEIKSVLHTIEDIDESFVAIKTDDGVKTLVAYFTGSNNDLGTLRNHLQEQLPAFMIPLLVQVQSIPRLPNGKVDKSKLFEIEIQDVHPTTYAPPTNELEEQLVGIWQKVLQIDRVGVHDNFFSIGGDSLLSIQVVSNARNRQIDIEPSAIFQYQTIASLAKHLSNKAKAQLESQWTSIVPMKEKGDQPPLFLLHSGGAHIIFYRDLANEVKEGHPVYSIQPKGLVEEVGHESIEEMARDYIKAIQSIQPEGPYYLLGTCFSNTVGLEMLHQLKDQGSTNNIFYVIDSGPQHLIPPSPNGEKKPVRRFFAMLKKGDWYGIQKKFLNRFKRINSRLVPQEKNEVEKELMELTDSLYHLYNNYTWKPIDSSIVLIRSSEFSEKKRKNYHVDHWQHLSKGQLEVFKVEGNHLELFDYPAVTTIASVVSDHKSSIDAF